MEMKYVVGGRDSTLDEQNFCFINASDGNEALERYIRLIGIKKASFIKSVYDRNINISFAEMFWLQTDEEETVFINTGEVLASGNEFDKRVKDFFASQNEYTTLYLRHWYSQGEVSEVEFPDEMLVYMYLHSSWIDGLSIIPFNEIAVF